MYAESIWLGRNRPRPASRSKALLKHSPSLNFPLQIQHTAGLQRDGGDLAGQGWQAN